MIPCHSSCGHCHAAFENYNARGVGQSKIFLLVLLCVWIVVQYLNVYYLRMSIQGPDHQISLNLLQNMGCSNGKMFMHMGSLFSTFEKSEI